MRLFARLFDAPEFRNAAPAPPTAPAAPEVPAAWPGTTAYAPLAPPAPGLALDPVCGTWVKPEAARGSSARGDVTYHFCSTGCHAAFDASPYAYPDAPYY